MENLGGLIEKRLGFGSLRFPLLPNGDVDVITVSNMIDIFINKGFKYFEVAYNYHQSETTIRDCLVNRYNRNLYLLADKMPVNEIKSSQQYKIIFNEQLKRCGVSFFDFYLLHNIGYTSWISTEKLGGFQFLSSLKEEGKTKYIGFSFHDKAEILDEILNKYHNDIDFVQLQINYLDWDSPVIQSRKCYEIACKYNIPIFVMEPVKGGRLVNLSSDIIDDFKQILPNASMASWALRWVASLENIAIILSGMSDIEQVKDNTNCMYAFNPLTDNEKNVVFNAVKKIRKEQKIACTQCRYCVSKCPQNIPIPELLHLYENDNKNHVGRMYERICMNKGKASSCIKCGKCEQACSQHLEIRKYITDIAKVYETFTLKRKLAESLDKLHLLEPSIRLRNIVLSFKGKK